MLSLFGVQGDAHTFAGKIESQGGDKDSHAGEDNEPPGIQDVLFSAGNDISPTGVGGLNAETQIAEGSFGEDCTGDAEDGTDEDRRQCVWQDVAEDNSQVGGAGGFGGLDVIHIPESKKLCADKSRGTHPSGQSDHESYVPDAGSDEGGDGD